MFYTCHFQISNKLLDDFILDVDLEWSCEELEKTVKYFLTKYESNLFKNSIFQFIIGNLKLEKE